MDPVQLLNCISSHTTLKLIHSIGSAVLKTNLNVHIPDLAQEPDLALKDVPASWAETEEESLSSEEVILK
jgi:hypothetical protein